MNFKELLQDATFNLETNVELALMRMAEDLGFDRREITAGKHDGPIDTAKAKILEHIIKYEKLTK